MRGLRVDAEHKGLYLLLLAFHAAKALGKEDERGMKNEASAKQLQTFRRVYGELQAPGTAPDGRKMEALRALLRGVG